jgi:hypothetical protein
MASNLHITLTLAMRQTDAAIQHESEICQFKVQYDDLTLTSDVIAVSKVIAEKF